MIARGWRETRTSRAISCPGCGKLPLAAHNCLVCAAPGAPFDHPRSSSSPPSLSLLRTTSLCVGSAARLWQSRTAVSWRERRPHHACFAAFLADTRAPRPVHAWLISLRLFS